MGASVFGAIAAAAVCGAALGLVEGLAYVIALAPPTLGFGTAVAAVLRAAAAWSLLSVAAAVAIALLAAPLIAWLSPVLGLRSAPVATGVAVSAVLFVGLIANIEWLPTRRDPRTLLGSIAIVVTGLLLWYGLARWRRASWWPRWTLRGVLAAVLLPALAYGCSGLLLRGAREWKPQEQARSLLGDSSVGPTRRPPTNPEPAPAILPPGTSVVIVVIDALRADHCSCYGYARPTTPNIDAWAEHAVLFDNAVAQRNKTTPSIASLHTGLYPHSHGAFDIGLSLSPRATTLAEVLSEQGYATYAFVANANVGQAFGLAQGFDRVTEFRGDQQDRDDLLMDAVVGALQERSTDDRPRFVYAHVNGPHARYVSPPPHSGMFVGDAVYASSPVRWLPIGGFQDYYGTIAANVVLEGSPHQHDPAYYIAEYDARVHFGDAAFGTMLARLRDLDLADDLLLILTADHGESFGEHGWYFQHGETAYEEQMHVPLIFSHPRLRPHRVPDAVATFSIMPSVLDLCGIATPAVVEAPSLLGRLLRRPNPEPDAPVFSVAHPRPLRVAARTAGRKLIWNCRHRPAPNDMWNLRLLLTRKRLWRYLAQPEWEYYDLASDRREQTNRWQQAGPEAERLQRELLTWVAGLPAEPLFGPATHPEVDPQTLNELRDLGYVR